MQFTIEKELEKMPKKQKLTIVDVSQNEFCPVSLLLTGQPLNTCGTKM